MLQLLHFDLEQEIYADKTAVQQVDADGCTALQWACACGDVATTAMLLRYGADPDRVDHIGQGPLRSSIKTAEPDCMNLLLNAGATVDIIDHWKQTRLIAVNYYPAPERFMPFLLAKGADVNAQDYNGHSPLSEAVKHVRPEAEAVEILLRHGASVNLRDNWGMTPFHEAVKSNAHGALRLMLATSYDPRIQNNQQQTILHMVANEADTLTLSILSEASIQGLSITQKDAQGFTALHAADARRQAIRKMLEDEKQVDENNLGWDKAWRHLIDTIMRPLPPLHIPKVLIYGLNPSEHSGSSYDSWHSAMDDFAAVL